ncbi:MAG: 23S rRNA (pseudouridine(1915)-N(3))-methyltransferase RlmH [Veillonellaceae bacterium]|nr:23S rRNA (pseudouridine(1915)-N(3))-methyltransferase RlmH [Veillonellaceae bacterium]MDD6923310.1 23S rRNA (pseudouridine(1915)-N(3))-methyltransferase RlmH [Veillonellaceae bacterium]
MEITIIAAGKAKLKFLDMGIAEYLKRLQPYAKVRIIETKEEKMPDSPSEAEKAQILDAEGKLMLSKVTQGSYIILLDVYGRELSSEELADKIADLQLHGKSRITFIIGGTFGVSEELRHRADLRLSLSRMTFTHPMARLLLTEQIYRAFKIIRGEKYHW